MTLQLRYTAHSEIGLVRKNNQDSGYASERLLVVADGMGGAAAGDLASATAIQQLRKADRGADADPVTGEEMLELLAGTLLQANEKINDLVADDHSLEGMGTTVTGALFDGERLGLVHIGDSRAYLQRGHELLRLTHDHSWVQSLVDEGKISEEEAAYHPHRSLLLKVLNGQPQSDPDVALIDLEPGDRLLFCSDGLCGLVEDDELLQIVTSAPHLEEVLDQLIRAAHREGGVDNITIILADVIDGDPDATRIVQADGSAEATVPLEGIESVSRGSRVATAQPRQEPRVVGAAVDREIPVIGLAPQDDITRTDAAGSTVPEAPVPVEDLDAEAHEALRYAPTLRPRRRLWRGILVTTLVLGLLAGALGAGYAWSRTQFFVAPSGDSVAIHRGLAQTVLGIPLSGVYEVQNIRLADLPPFYRDRVTKTISLHSLDEARITTDQLRAEADRCIAVRRARAAPAPQPAPAPVPGAPSMSPSVPSGTWLPPTAVASPTVAPGTGEDC